MRVGMCVCLLRQGQESVCLRDDSHRSQHRRVVGTDDKLLLIAITQWVVIAFYFGLMATINADYKTLGAFAHSPDIAGRRSGSRHSAEQGRGYRTAVRHTMTVRLIQCRSDSLL